ncbi:FtsH protease activity modulator HflK [bacterium]|nr:FtsH protease activity modulator HflK [bacterium]
MSNQGKGPDQMIHDLNDYLSKLGRKGGSSRNSGNNGNGGNGGGGPGDFQPDTGWKQLLSIAVVVVLALSAFQSFYTIDVSEEGVLTRFGRYVKTVGPGLHFKIPMGVEKVIRVKSKVIHQEEFGFRTTGSRSARRTFSKTDLDSESLMLTGDLNVADVEWTLQYRIIDPWKYLFKARSVETNIRDVSISIMRRVVGDKLVNEVLTTGRVSIASEAKVLTQEVLDKYDMGIQIERINLQDVNPPQAVKDAFNEVNAAKQEQEQTINQAEREYNRQIPKSKGQAEQQIKEAQAFAIDLRNRSLGDAEKFKEVLSEYKKAPSITKKRLYIETMKEIFTDIKDLTIIDSNVKGVLPVYGGLTPTAKGAN